MISPINFGNNPLILKAVLDNLKLSHQVNSTKGRVNISDRGRPIHSKVNKNYNIETVLPFGEAQLFHIHNNNRRIITQTICHLLIQYKQ